MSTQGTGLRRRNRKINSCLACRKRKYRCSRTYPCDNCTRSGRDCVFMPSAIPLIDENRRRQIPSVAQSVFSNVSSPFPETRTASGVHLEKATPDTECIDGCLRIGKMSITERVGGILKHDFVSTLETEMGYRKPTTELFRSTEMYPVNIWFSRNVSFPLPSLMIPVTSAPKEDEDWPSATEYETLFEQYFTAVDPITHLIPREWFLEQMRNSQSTTVAKFQQNIAKRALRLAMCYAAAISMPMAAKNQEMCKLAQDSLCTRLKSLTESALGACDIFNNTQLEVFQGMVIYLTCHCRGAVSRSHSIFLGSIVRRIQMILERDFLDNDLSPVEIQMRKHLWQQVSYLELRSAEATGPQPNPVHEYDLAMPQNVDDAVMCSQPDQPTLVDVESRTWSDSTFSLIRYECNQIHRRIFRLREQIFIGTMDPSVALQTVDRMKNRVIKRYGRLLNDKIPIQRNAGLVMRLLLTRCDLMLLQSQTAMWRSPDPDLDLRDRFSSFFVSQETTLTACRAIEAALTIAETARILETDKDLEPWSWYPEAYQQYHGLIFLLIELYHGAERYAARIIRISEYVFGASDTTTDPSERSRQLLSSIKTSMASFLSARGLYEIHTSQDLVANNDFSPLTSFNENGLVQSAAQGGTTWNNMDPDLCLPDDFPVEDDFWDPWPIEYSAENAII